MALAAESSPKARDRELQRAHATLLSACSWHRPMRDVGSERREVALTVANPDGALDSGDEDHFHLRPRLCAPLVGSHRSGARQDPPESRLEPHEIGLGSARGWIGIVRVKPDIAVDA